MQYRGNGRVREVPATLYTENQIESTLRTIGVEIDHESPNDFICFCPFHGNTNTPAFSVSRTSGKFLCFNEACSERGSLIELVKYATKKTDFEAARLINKAKTDNPTTFADKFKKAVEKVEMPVWKMETIKRLHEQFWASPEAVAYMRGRGFDDETLNEYKIGYSAKKRVISVPMFSESGLPVGVIGRAISSKRFRNSDKLPVRATLWNIHRARRLGDTVIICEASFDAMRISQAGYPNVVACLGGNFNESHAEQLMKYFKTIIIFTDWDDTREHKYDKNGKRCKACQDKGYGACKGHNPGRDTGKKIAQLVKGKRIKWASIGYKKVYPKGAKDAGDMSIEDIRLAIENAVSNQEYSTWGLYYEHDLVV